MKQLNWLKEVEMKDQGINDFISICDVVKSEEEKEGGNHTVTN